LLRVRVRVTTWKQLQCTRQRWRAKLEAFAKARGWAIKAIYTDDAISGSELNRPGLQALLNAAKSDPMVQVVLAWDRNRIARPKDAIDGMILERDLLEAGKRVVYASTGTEASRSFADGLMSFVEHHQNGDYLRKLSRDTMRGLVDRAKRGFWPGGPIPFGYDRLILDGTDAKRIVRDLDTGGQVMLHPGSGEVIEELPKGKRHKKQDHEVCSLIPSEPERVRAVQRLFEGFASGKPTRVLRDELNQSGFRTSRGSSFTVQTILPILENRAYLGECVYNQRTLSKWHTYTNGQSVERTGEGVERRPECDLVVCKDAWEPIVNRDTFDQVQKRRKESKGKAVRRGPASKAKYLLTGLLYCGVCGGRMTGRTTKNSRGYGSKNYVCGRHDAGHKDECPKWYSVPAKNVEGFILGVIKTEIGKLANDDTFHRFIREELERVTGGQTDAKKQLQRRLADLDQKLANVRQHLVTMDPELAESVGLYQTAADLKEERTEAERELERISEHVPDLPDCETLRLRAAAELDRFKHVLEHATIEEQRELVACYVQKIKADPDSKQVLISLYPPVVSQKIAGAGFEPATSGL